MNFPHWRHSILNKTRIKTRTAIFCQAISCGLNFPRRPATNKRAIVRLDVILSVEGPPRADEELARWLGIRRVGITLAKPPLKPIPSTPPSLLAAEGFIQTARFAANAGVALLATEKSLQVVDMETGKPILHDVKISSQPGFLSPNGRLFTWGGDNSVKIRDTETGSLVTELQQTHAHEFHWLDNRFAIYNQSQDGPQKAILIDFKSGRESAIAGIQGPVMRAVRVPATDNQFVVCTHRTLVKIEIARDAQEPEAKLVKESPGGRSCAINTSGTTADGRRFFQASVGLAITSLETLEQEIISLEPFYIQTALATPDPDKILITGFVKSSPARGGPRDLLYSIGERTVTPIDRSKLSSHRFVDIAALKKLAVVNDSKVELLDKLPLQSPLTLSQFSGDLIQEATQRKLEEFERQQAAPQGLYGSRTAYVNDMPRHEAPTPAPTPLESQLAAQLATLAKDAQIDAIGVYQGNGSAQRPGDARKSGFVEVRVRRAARPVLLVLSSYEAVRWTLTLEPGARLAGVLISGYHPSQVIGAGAARTVTMGSSYAYKMGTAEYKSLDDNVFRMTGKRIGLFQGRYEGGAFSVGG